MEKGHGKFANSHPEDFHDPKLIEIITDVERRICHYYGFNLGNISATNFVITENTSSPRSFDKAEQTKQEQNDIETIHGLPRSAVLVWQDQEDDGELHLGLYFRNQAIEPMTRACPLISLNHQNLDAFCLIIEEISHFYLIVQRALEKREVSKLELEWQAEIDKLLIAAWILEEQTGDPHLHQLAHSLFSTPIFSSEETRYQEASDQAAKLWYYALKNGIGTKISLFNPNFRRFMRTNYQKPLQEKIPFSQIAWAKDWKPF